MLVWGLAYIYLLFAIQYFKWSDRMISASNYVLLKRLINCTLAVCLFLFMDANFYLIVWWLHQPRTTPSRLFHHKSSKKRTFYGQADRKRLPLPPPPPPLRSAFCEIFLVWFLSRVSHHQIGHWIWWTTKFITEFADKFVTKCFGDPSSICVKSVIC